MPNIENPGDIVEIGKIGAAIYENDIFPRIAHVKRGKAIAIDITSGDYEIDSLSLEAARRLKQRRPDAVVYKTRVETPGAVRTGYLQPSRR